jgi:hypothetical protein
MKRIPDQGAALLLFAVVSAMTDAAAGPGHDHGSAPAVTGGKASPRFEARSDLFEVVGVLGNGELSITVDRYASNAPLLGARVELESGPVKALGQFHADHGDYSFVSAPFEKPGSYPIVLTISAADDIEMLAGNLLVPDAAAADTGHAHSHVSWQAGAALGALAMAFAALVAVVIRRRTRRISHG